MLNSHIINYMTYFKIKWHWRLSCRHQTDKQTDKPDNKIYNIFIVKGEIPSTIVQDATNEPNLQLFTVYAQLEIIYTIKFYDIKNIYKKIL